MASHRTAQGGSTDRLTTLKQKCHAALDWIMADLSAQQTFVRPREIRLVINRDGHVDPSLLTGYPTVTDDDVAPPAG